MKHCFCLILVLGFSGRENNAANGIIIKDTESDVAVNNPNRNYANLFQNNFVNQSDVNFGFDAGNPDINARIERPCEIYDSFCIRRFFAEHSKCRISAEPVPEPLFRAQSSTSFSAQNISAILNNLKYTGIRTGKVEEFYINKATDNLVITLGFDYISLFGYVRLKFYRRGREPAITQDYAGLAFGPMSITVVIPHLNDLRLDKAEISAFAHVPVYPYVVFPGLVPTDPELLTTFTSFAVSLRTNELEQLLTDGNFYASTFIQYNICDFGLKVL